MKNTRSWFYKMLFSYLPAFFLLSCVLFLISFLAISENIKKTTVKSTYVFSEQVSQVLENFLQPIERMVTKDILVDTTFIQYFKDHKYGTYENYEIVQKLRSLSLDFPDIDSVYVFRQADHMVLSENMYSDFNQFADKDFILLQLNQNLNASWSEKRMYYDQKARKSSEVVSLVRKVPFLTGDQGIVVVNISVSTIRSLVMNMSSHNINFVNLYDRAGSLIFSTAVEQGKEDTAKGKEIVKVKSDFTNWIISSGIKNAESFSFFSGFAYFWVATCFLTLLVGVLWIVYVTRKNYKPIESIMNRINEFFLNKNYDIFGKGKPDEMRFISMAIDNLLEQSNIFQNQYAEDLIHIRRHLFMELMSGHRAFTLEEWKTNMRRLGQEKNFDEVSFGILEIDKYPEFSVQYSDRDQYLLKFVIQSMVNEMAQNHFISIWCEWITHSRLGILYFLNNKHEQFEEQLSSSIPQMCGTAIAWVNDNLDFTVTIGMSGYTDNLADLPGLLEKASDNLNYKAILGNQRVINSSDIILKPKQDIFTHLQLVHQIVKVYRMGEEWDALFLRFFEEMKMALLSSKDITSLMNYFIFYLDKEMNAVSLEVQSIWTKTALSDLTLMLQKVEMLDELQTRTHQIMKAFEMELRSLRESRANYQLIHEVKKYIEECYANPDLSLAYLSDEFNINSRALSELFKKEYGEKFVDYLVRIRLTRAKELLQSTMEPVQDIAVKVGYVHPFSFIRVFKKVVGMTPGDFRK